MFGRKGVIHNIRGVSNSHSLGSGVNTDKLKDPGWLGVRLPVIQVYSDNVAAMCIVHKCSMKEEAILAVHSISSLAHWYFCLDYPLPKEVE